MGLLRFQHPPQQLDIVGEGGVARHQFGHPFDRMHHRGVVAVAAGKLKALAAGAALARKSL